MSSELHPDVALTLSVLGQPGSPQGFTVAEADNAEYGAAIAQLGRSRVRLRVGKVTPTKVGLFVAVWRRAISGTTEPFSAEEDVAALIIIAREAPQAGAFVFPKAALVEHGIVSVGGAGGKRGFRLYPPWSATSNPQADRSKRWQGEYFGELSDVSKRELFRAEALRAQSDPA